MKDSTLCVLPRSGHRDNVVVRYFTLLIMLSYAILSLFPFIWAFLVSLSPIVFTATGGPHAGELVNVDIKKFPPEINIFTGTVFGAPMTLSNYFAIFRLFPFARWFFNTVIFACAVSTGVIFFNTVAAYAFARLRFPLREFWFSVFLATMMVPFHVTMIPLYNLMVKMGWINTYQGLIIPKLISVSIIFFMRSFFIGFPKSLEEAAYIDGAGIPRILFTIVLPNCKAAIAAQFIYVFLGSWNEFMWPLIVTSKPEMATLTMGLTYFQGGFYTDWQYLMAATMMITVPMFVVFIIFQKQFISSNISSGVKG